MVIAEYCLEIPPNQWYHEPSLTNSKGYTVAMYLAEAGIEPPKEWYHDPRL